MKTGNFELQFCPGANRHCREARRERTFDFYTDRLRVVTLGSLADKKIEWVAKGPHERYVKEEVSRLAGGDEAGDPNAGPSRPDLSFRSAAAGIGDDGKDDVLNKLSELEKDIGGGPTEAQAIRKRTGYS